MIKIITDIKGSEPDILTAYQHEDLVLKSGRELSIYRTEAPRTGWTTERLREACDGYCRVTNWTSFEVIDAYVGKQWVGSTEV